MKVYLPQEGLVKSSELIRKEEPPYQLYSSISWVYPFVKFEEELRKINDYCYFLIEQLEGKVKESIQNSDEEYEIIKEARGNRKYDSWEIEDALEPKYMFSEVSTWEEILQNINKNTLLLLLLSYLESSLNEIAVWFCKEKKIKMVKKERKPQIEFYLEKIGECCNYDLNYDLKEELNYLSEVRKIRNQFVHQEWSQTEKYDNKFYIKDILTNLSLIYEKIEKSACIAGIIEENNLEKNKI